MTAGEAAAAAVFAIPLFGGVSAFSRPRAGRAIAFACAAVFFVAAAALASIVWARGPVEAAIGGWPAPVGIAWRIDGPSALMLLLTGALGVAVTAARAAEVGGGADPEGRLFWSLWLFLCAGLAALFVVADAFHVYVALELVALAAVALVALPRGAALVAAWRYFVATLVGSTLYLLGVAVLYGEYGALDLSLIGAEVAADPASPAARLAAASITAGLLLKAAIAPLHFWLPAAHGRAPAPVSAALSGLVVAAALYVLLRFWLGPFSDLLDAGVGVVLAAVSAAAALWGGLQALAQRELKMILAYSTISQLGVAALALPIAAAGEATAAERGAVLLLAAHGLAKAALFLAAGAIAAAAGAPARLAGPGGLRAPGAAYVAFALAAASLVGLPPTGGFAAKFRLLEGAAAAGAWIPAALILAATALTGAYLFRAFEGMAPARPRPGAGAGRTRGLSIPALALAAGAWAMGFALQWLEALLERGGGTP